MFNEGTKHARGKKQIAIVHDALCVGGGAERVVLWMAKAFPNSPIFTSVYLPTQTYPEFKNLDVRVLPFSRFIRNERQFKLLYPFWLLELQRINFKEYDFVLSSSTYLAKFIKPYFPERHRAYIYAPFRLLWKPESYNPESLPTPRIFTKTVTWLSPNLRRWDIRNTQRIPKIATTCRNMADEIAKRYHRPSEVIYPPISIADYSLSEQRGDYFLSVSRLISHKRVDLAIKACNQLKEKLIVVGDGPERKSLERMAGNTIQFTGKVSDAQLKLLYRDSKALIFPSHEDFGIVPLEAQACGKPVIAFGRGGVLETVKEEETGLFFKEQETGALVSCMEEFKKRKFDQHRIREWVIRFDIQSFITKLNNFVLK
jgi:glycosyltransferase involved in cell wall biosynthesis